MTEQTDAAEVEAVLGDLIAQIDTGLAQGAASIPTPLAWATVSQRLHDLRRGLAAREAAARAEERERVAVAIEAEMWQFRRVTGASSGHVVTRAYGDAARIARTDGAGS